MALIERRKVLAAGLFLGACTPGDGDYPSVPDVFSDGEFAWSIDDPPHDGEFVRRVTRVEDDIWVLGHGIRRFDGTSWSDVPLPPDARFDEFFRGAASDGAAVWTAGTTIRRFDGATWTDESGRMPDPMEPGFGVAYDLVQAPDGAIWTYRGEHMDGTLVRDLAGTVTEVAAWNNLYYPFGFLSDGTFLQGAHFGGQPIGLLPETWEPQVAYVDTPWIEVPEGVASWSLYGDGRLSLVRGDPFVQGGLTEFASVPAEAFGVSPPEDFSTGVRQGGFDLDGMTFVEVVDIAAVGDELAVLLWIDGPGIADATALVFWDGATARLAPDRFAYRPAAVLSEGTDLLVVARNGAVFRGTPR